MEIFKIVLTGGPCAGKTTFLNTIKEYLEKKQILCFVLSETATELMAGNFKPIGNKLFEFQKFVIKRQLEKEDDSFNYVKQMLKNEEKCVIICDRGIFDNAAYLKDKEEFKKLLSIFRIPEMETLDSYDMVLNLFSVATCKPEAYNTENNKLRTETPKQASTLDLKTAQAWANHRNIKLISSNISLEEEGKIVLDCVMDLINGNDKRYVDRYIIDTQNSDFSPYEDLECINVNEFVFDIGLNDYKYSIYERCNNGLSYVLEMYKEKDGQREVRYSKCISQKEFNKLFYKYKFIGSKQRREVSFIYNRALFRICFYENDTILEVHKNLVENINNTKIPENLKTVCKVNGDYPDFDKTNFKQKIR